MGAQLSEYDQHFQALGEPLRELVPPFESLGYNCEFAFVQHTNGFGEGNLLSWALADDALAVTKLLEQDFAGLFTLDQLQPELGGMLFRDATYNIAFHSKMLGERVNGAFVAHGSTTARDRIYAEDMEKFSYLTAKMRRQLAQGTRIWLYKARPTEALGNALALHGALNRFGRNRLLWVAPARNPAEAGQVEALDQTLFTARLSAYSTEACAWKYDTPGWDKLLRNALRLAGR